MAVEPSYEHPTAEPRDTSSRSWLHARALWAGVSIIVMWLAVLFVGLFGGDFIANSSTSFTKIPVVVFLLPFVLPATIAVARRGFTSGPEEHRSLPEDKSHMREEATTQPSTFRAKPA
jgi:hypothetical protein